MPGLSQALSGFSIRLHALLKPACALLLTGLFAVPVLDGAYASSTHLTGRTSVSPSPVIRACPRSPEEGALNRQRLVRFVKQETRRRALLVIFAVGCW